jgi:hypothetical protein
MDRNAINNFGFLLLIFTCNDNLQLDLLFKLQAKLFHVGLHSPSRGRVVLADLEYLHVR